VRAVDLNADVGEGAAPFAEERELLRTVTSASIGCGAHAGTRADLRAAAAAAVEAGAVVGAHPAYPDRVGAGRRPLEMTARALAASLEGQLAALEAEVRRVGGVLRYLKPHGALYHLACVDDATARLVAEVARSGGMPVVLLAAGAPAASAAREAGVEVVDEAFVDRAYLADGSLVPRDRPGALLDERAAVAQALSLAVEGRAPAAGGGWVRVRASSLCVHGDSPGAARLAVLVRRALEEAGVEVAPFAA
jgi:UPF0271 protein